MANYCNLRLVVTGHADDLAPFRRAAGALTGHVDTTHSTIFTAEMEEGECGDLQAHGLTRVDGDLRRTKYTFQGRNDDHVDHFTEVSRRYPRLAFVLVVSDPPENDSYLLRKGRSRSWRMSDRAHERLFARHLRTWDIVPQRGRIDFHNLDYADAGIDMAYWDAAFEGMDVATARWDADVIAWLRALPMRQPRRRGALR